MPKVQSVERSTICDAISVNRVDMRTNAQGGNVKITMRFVEDEIGVE
jgi:hypothetical protein